MVLEIVGIGDGTEVDWGLEDASVGWVEGLGVWEEDGVGDNIVGYMSTCYSARAFVCVWGVHD